MGIIIVSVFIFWLLKRLYMDRRDARNYFAEQTFIWSEILKEVEIEESRAN